MSVLPVSIPTKDLAVNLAASATGAVLYVNNIEKWDGTNLASGDFGTQAFAVLRNSANTQVEFIEFDPTTIANSAITISKRGLNYAGGQTANEEDSYNWIANDTKVELGSHIPQLLRQFVEEAGAETIAGVKTFSSSPIVPTPTGNTDAANKAYVDGVAIAGASDANTTTKGIVEEATQAEVDARTATGGTGAKLFAPLDKIRATLYHDYAADAGANDTYAVTITPAPTAYTTGMVVEFKANTANTGACTINVNALGAKSLKVNKDLDPQDGYIKAGAIVLAVYDGTNFQIQSVSGKPSVSQSGEEIYAASSSGNDTYAITLAPAPAAYVTGMVIRFKADVANTGAATLNVNALGAKTIVKQYNITLGDGDIKANQLVEVIYDGTNFQLLSPISNYSGLLYRATATVTVTASGEQTVLSQTIPGNTLGTGGGVRVKMGVKCVSSGVDTCAFKFKYGATTIVTSPTFTLGSGTTVNGFIEFTVLGSGATNTQYGNSIYMLSRIDSAVAVAIDANQSQTGTAAEDSTADKTIAITVNQSAGNQTWTFMGIIIEKIF